MDHISAFKVGGVKLDTPSDEHQKPKIAQFAYHPHDPQGTFVTHGEKGELIGDVGGRWMLRLLLLLCK